MPIAHALHIGMQHINPTNYGGNDGWLSAPANDAQALSTIVQQLNFQSVQLLLSEQATKQKLREQIALLQQTLQAGDLLVLTYSGHGGLVLNTDSEQDDPGEGRHDESWCLFDGQIVDDEIYNWLTGFAEGVRILVISDSCFSGTVIKEATDEEQPATTPTTRSRGAIQATVLLLASAQEDEEAYDGETHSRFMTRLLEVWDDGNFRGNYQDFQQAISRKMPDWSQKPNLLLEGKNTLDFVQQQVLQV